MKNKVVMTCDTLPASIKNMDDRLKSRFSWGLTVELEPPELEMRVAILQKKAEAAHVQLQEKAAFFIAQHIRSNVRELEGAFKRVAAHSLFQHKPIDIELATEALQDILVEAQRQITVEHIMKTVGDFYQLKIADLIGKKAHPHHRPPAPNGHGLGQRLDSTKLAFHRPSVWRSRPYHGDACAQNHTRIETNRREIGTGL